MKQLVRVFALFLALAFAFGMMPFSASAEEGSEETLCKVLVWTDANGEHVIPYTDLTGWDKEMATDLSGTEYQLYDGGVGTYQAYYNAGFRGRYIDSDPVGSVGLALVQIGDVLNPGTSYATANTYEMKINRSGDFKWSATATGGAAEHPVKGIIFYDPNSTTDDPVNASIDTSKLDSSWYGKYPPACHVSGADGAALCEAITSGMVVVKAELREHNYQGGHCTVCGAEGGETGSTECTHETYDNDGFCTCGAYEPALLNDDNVYEIGNAGQLYWFAALVNGGEYYANAILTADIVVNDKVLNDDGTLVPDTSALRAWMPIGKNGYCGMFRGNGHTISGLYNDDQSEDYIGLFSVLDFNGIVVGVILDDTYFFKYNYCGGIVAHNSGSVSECSFSGTVRGNAAIGGIVGYNDGAVENCSSSGTVRGNTYIGGIVGYNTVRIEHGHIFDCEVVNCYSTASVVGIIQHMGGIVGANKTMTDPDTGRTASAEVINCYFNSDYFGGSAVGLDEGETTLTEAKTSAQFASGEVCYLLNGDQSDLYWLQTLGTDAYPVFEGETVYYGYISCAEDATAVYTNDSAASDIKPDHTWSDATCTAPKTCDRCGATEGDSLPHTFNPNTGNCVSCDTLMAEASLTIGRLTTFYESAQEAANAGFGSRHTLELCQDVNLSGYLTIHDGCMLDLSGCTLSSDGNMALYVSGSARITDSGETGSIKVTGNPGWGIWVQGDLVMERDFPIVAPSQAFYYNSGLLDLTALSAPSSYNINIANVTSDVYSQILLPAGNIFYIDQTPVARDQALAADTELTIAPCYTHADADTDHSCDLCLAEVGDHEAAEGSHDCGYCGEPVTDCADTDGDGKCDICGELLGVIRVAGANRWATALLVADEMKAALGDEKFDAIIIASGNDFADALAGSYLATVKNAPILLSYGGDNEKYAYLDNDNINYVKENLAEDGVVYILGGEKAVPTLYEDGLEGYDVVRLGGANRFETNILILEEAGIADGSEVLVCTSANFADSLSASATGKPILLVWNDRGVLYGNQPEFLEELKEKGCTFTILGGENAVSAKLADEVGKYGEVDRLAGNTRMETSVLVAEKYFDAPETAVLAYAWNYPDGLCGGSLAYALKAPLILTMPKYEQAAVDYAAENDITTGYVLGGDGLIGNAEVRAIFAMAAADQIVVKN